MTRPKLNRYLDVLHTNALHARSLVQNVLNFSQNEQGEANKTHIVYFIEAIMTFLQERQNVEFSWTKKHLHDFSDYQILMSKTDFITILSNLLSNADDATHLCDQKDIQVSFDILDHQIADNMRKKTNAKKDNQYLVIDVSDNGTGIPDDVKQKVLQPFFTTKSIGKGTGLGLSTVYGIVKKWNGMMEIHSQEEKGTIVSLCLPVTQHKVEQ